MTHDERRANLLAAAATIVCEDGVTAVTVDRTAQIAGVNRALVYRFFDNSDDLLVQLAEQEYAKVEAKLAQAMATADTFPDRIRAVIETYLRAVTGGEQRVVDELVRTNTGSGPLATWRDRKDAQTVFYLAQLITDAHPAISSQRAVILSAALGSGAQGMLALARMGWSVDDLIEEFVIAAEGAIAAVAATADRRP